MESKTTPGNWHYDLDGTLYSDLRAIEEKGGEEIFGHLIGPHRDGNGDLIVAAPHLKETLELIVRMTHHRPHATLDWEGVMEHIRVAAQAELDRIGRWDEWPGMPENWGKD